MTGETSSDKPRLLFFQWDHSPNRSASDFLTLHMSHHVKCLSVYFDVKVISEDCDYGAACDRFEPDLALFESGYRTHGSRRIRIANTGAHPEVPKLGLHNGDPWCDRRSGFLSDMEAWGIETFFAIGTCTPGYMPTAAGSMFVWPNFIDPEMFRDYGQEKVVPVMLTGQAYDLYPWRQGVFAALTENYPCLVSPAFQYESRAAARMLSGERYARALNASWVAPSCGTMGHELVRKHLEIPGAASLLVAERTPVLEAAGFVDGVNCVFAGAEDVVARLDALFAEPERMREMTAAGHRLVHERHTLYQRPQLREWYELNRRLAPGEKIVQPGPFEPLEIAGDTGGAATRHIACQGLDRIALERAEAAIAAGRTAEARSGFEQALHYVKYLPEARLGLARCDLADGRPEAALAHLGSLIYTTTVDYGAARPDPVDWALYLVALVCAGRQDEAVALRDRYPQAHHSELDHVLRLLDGIAGGPARPRPTTVATARATSVHEVPPRDFAAFTAWLEGVRRSCDTAPADGAPENSAVADPGRAASHSRRSAAWLRRLDRSLVAVGAGGLRPNVPPAPGFGYTKLLLKGMARRVLRDERSRQMARQARDALQTVPRLLRAPTGRRS